MDPEARFAVFHYGLAEASAGLFLGAACAALLLGAGAAWARSDLDVRDENPDGFRGRDGAHLRPVPPRRCFASPRRPGPQVSPVALRDPHQDFRLAHLAELDPPLAAE